MGPCSIDPEIRDVIDWTLECFHHFPPGASVVWPVESLVPKLNVQLSLPVCLFDSSITSLWHGARNSGHGDRGERRGGLTSSSAGYYPFLLVSFSFGSLRLFPWLWCHCDGDLAINSFKTMNSRYFSSKRTTVLHVGCVHLPCHPPRRSRGRGGLHSRRPFG